MPRSNQPRRRRSSVSEGGSKWQRQAPEFDLERARLGVPGRQSAPDGEWIVRSVSAAGAQKVYTCPGCHHNVDPGVAHLVVWRQDALFGDDAGLRDRRHWHNNCWRGRSYRYN